MKICLVTETFPPEINGVSMTLNRLVNGLSQKGHEIHVIRPKQFKTDGEKKPEAYTENLVFGVPIPGYDILKLGIAGFGELKKNWKSFEPDVIHIATEGPLGTQALFSALRNKVPVVSSFHTNFHSYGKHYHLGWLTGIGLAGLKYFHNKTRLTFVPSEDLRQDLEAEGFKNLKIMSRGVDTELFSPAKRDLELRKTWGVAEDQPVMIYVGRLAGEKNIPLAVKAYEQVLPLCPDMKFVLIGDGPLRGSIEKAHPELIFAGMQRGEDLARHYASGDVFLFPSVTETFGNVVTEALASGLAVLGYDYAAPGRYIKEGHNGWLAPFDDSDAFLRQSEKIFQSQSAWPEVRQNARTTAESLTWGTILDSYIRDVEEAKCRCE
ncbi:MAG: glycosyltransferase family 1 protein [Verrucomicrobia bacterium]|nr:glycosyltransferase family 1 protein [Verrucomicrobiota bacterium]